MITPSASSGRSSRSAHLQILTSPLVTARRRGVDFVDWLVGLPLTPPSRMEFRLQMRPIGLDVLQDLVASGHLDAALLAEMPTFTVYSAVAEWAPGTSDPREFTVKATSHPNCQRYRCLYESSSADCDRRSTTGVAPAQDT